MGKSIYLTNRQIEAIKNAISQYEELIQSQEGSTNEEILKDYEELTTVLKKLSKPSYKNTIKRALEIANRMKAEGKI